MEVNVILQAVVSVISVIATAVISNSITKYRIQILEQKVEKHNQVIERVYKLEQKMEDIDHE